MTANLTYGWDTIPWNNMPSNIHSLFLDLVSEAPKLERLLATVPHLIRFTGHRRGLDNWSALGMALKWTPHLNYLRLDHCQLYDSDLVAILQGCSLELCELDVRHNWLQFALPALVERLACFTQLQ